jgi:hypothetical protein
VLIIRKAQMDALDASSREAFRERMLRHVAKDFPARAAELGPKGIRRLVDASIDKGPEYGIAGEDDLQAFLDLMIELGPGFDEEPALAWAREILTRTSLSGQAKVELIRRLR